MKIKGEICETGGKKLSNGRYVNEDGLTTFSVKYEDKDYDFVILMDGATGLGKDHQIVEGYTSAEWYVQYIMRKIQEELTENPTYDLKSVVNNSITKAIDEISRFEKDNSIVLEEYQKPSAALFLLRNNGNKTELFAIGDVQAIIAYKDGQVKQAENPNQIALQKLDGSVISRMVELSKENNCNVVDSRSLEEIEKMLQINRSKKNSGVEDGYWVCGTTEGAAEHGVCIEYDNQELAGIILASDGFEFSMLGLNEEQAYKMVAEIGTENVAKQIRTQQEEDPYCNKFPRFKKSDDLTAIYLDYLV